MASTSTQDGSQFLMPTVAQQLKKICEDNDFADHEIVLDVYLIVANNGQASMLPDATLMGDIERTDPNYWNLRTDISKRKAYLEELAKSKYMEALCKLNDPFKAVLTFLDHLKKSLAAIHASKNNKAPIDHQGNTFDGTYASESQLDEIAAANEAFNPAEALDILLSNNNTYQAVIDNEGVSAFMEGVAQSTGSGCGGRTAARTYSNTSGRTLAKAVVTEGVTLPNRYPLLFDWYTKILDDLKMGKLKEKDVDHDAKHRRDTQMEDLDKLSTVDPSEVAKETFEKNVVEKSLIVRQDRDEEQGMCHVFVLLDVSGSMMASDLGGRVCRGFAANIVTLALLNFAMKEHYKVWILPFEGRPDKIRSAETKQQAVDLMRWLGTVNYDGGGTDIEAAVMRAYDITTEDPNYKKCDIVLITDGCSSITRQIIDKKPERTKLRGIFISDDVSSYGAHFNRLVSACDSHAKMTWDNVTNSFSVGSTLQGISAPTSTVDPQ